MKRVLLGPVMYRPKLFSLIFTFQVENDCNRMSLDQSHEKRDYKQVLGKENYQEVVGRIKELTAFVQDLLNDSLPVDLTARSFLTRRFLFDHDNHFPSPILDSRWVSAFWNLDRGRMEFPMYFLVRYLFEQLSDTVKVITPLLKELNLASIQVKRFAALIYSAMLLIHVYVNGNKRTAHSVAFSYMYELRSDLVEEYFPYLAIHIDNCDSYFDGNTLPRQKITQILFMITSPEFISHWLGYVIVGEFKAIGENNPIQSTEAATPNYEELIAMWQNTLDGVTSQIEQNLQKSLAEIAETISEARNHNEVPETQLAEYRES